MARGIEGLTPPADILAQFLRYEDNALFHASGRRITTTWMKDTKAGVGIRRVGVNLHNALREPYIARMFGEQASAILNFKLPEMVQASTFPMDGDCMNIRPENLVARGCVHGTNDFATVVHASNEEKLRALVQERFEVERVGDALWVRSGVQFSTALVDALARRFFHAPVKYEWVPRNRRRTDKRFPTADELRAIFEYDPATGVISNRMRPGRDSSVAYHGRSKKCNSRGEGSLRYLQSSKFPPEVGRICPVDKAAIIMSVGISSPGMRVFHQDLDASNNAAVNLAASIPMGEFELFFLFLRGSMFDHFLSSSPPRGVRKKRTINDWQALVFDAGSERFIDDWLGTIYRRITTWRL